MMQTIQTAQPFDAEAMSLTAHAVIEASAGTGKTYSIGSIVLRIIAEDRATIGDILIMTYTEKATAENPTIRETRLPYMMVERISRP